MFMGSEVTMNRTLLLAPLAALALLLGCGGGNGSSSSPTPASSLAYTDPTSTGWRLTKDSSSTSTCLVLSLVGPSTTTARGVALTLSAPTAKLTYAKFSDGMYIQDGGVFTLYVSDSTEAQLLAGGVKNGELNLGLFQKGTTQSAKNCGKPLLKFALGLASGATTGNTSLTISKAKILNASSSPSLEDISVAVGTITLN